MDGTCSLLRSKKIAKNELRRHERQHTSWRHRMLPKEQQDIIHFQTTVESNSETPYNDYFYGSYVLAPDFGSTQFAAKRRNCQRRGLDAKLRKGNRLPGVDWRFAIAVSDAEHPGSAPNLRTVGIERVTQEGIDFVVKRGSIVCDAISKGQALSFLHTQGHFLPGQSAEQWRGEGLCIVLPLSEVISEVPHFVITSMVGSKRIARESTSGWPVDDKGGDSGGSGDAPTNRSSVANRSHLTEVMQKTRLELENGEVTIEELNECMRAFRFQPDRIECMWASPDSSVLWDRWEWERDQAADCPEGTIAWQMARNLVPH
eukprot:scaffold6026_cov163-Amphora_coffeaeformis.AAC.8